MKIFFSFVVTCKKSSLRITGYFTWFGDERVKIPIVTTQLEKSRDSVDAANVRAAYAEAAAAYITETDGTAATYAYNIEGKSTDAKWEQTGEATMEIAGVNVTMVKDTKSVSVAFATNGTYTITMNTTTVTEGKQ